MHALGGGLQGLGQSMTAAETERRENRGLALREAYMRQRMQMQHDFYAGENEADRTIRRELHDETLAARATENETDRALRRELSDEQIAAGDARAAAGRENQMAMLMERLKAGESQAVQELQAIIARQQAENAAGAAGPDTQELTRRERLLESWYPSIDPNTGETTTNRELASAAEAVRERTGKWPNQITLTADQVAEAARRAGVTLDTFDAFYENRKALLFKLPPIAAARRAMTTRTSDINLQ